MVLQTAIMAYNTRKCEATGYTPYFALFGRECITPGDALAATADLSDPDLMLDGAALHEHIT